MNTVSSRVTMASAVDAATSSTQNTSSEHSRIESKSGKEKHRKDSNKQEPAKASRHLKESSGDLIPKSKHRVYDSSALNRADAKLKKLYANECNCEMITKQTTTDTGTSLINKDRPSEIDDRPACKEHAKWKQQQDEQRRSDRSRVNGEIKFKANEEPIRKSGRFQTKYKYIDEDDGQLVELNGVELNDRNNNIKCDNEYRAKLNRLENGGGGGHLPDKLGNKQIELNKQLETNLINNLKTNLTAANLDDLADDDRLGDRLDDRLASLDNKLDNEMDRKIDSRIESRIDKNIANNIGNNIGDSIGDRRTTRRPNDGQQSQELNSEETNIEIETQLNSSVNYSNVNSSAALNAREQRKQTDKSSSIQAIASTAIKAKNHSNTMAKKERKTAKVWLVTIGHI